MTSFKIIKQGNRINKIIKDDNSIVVSSFPIQKVKELTAQEIIESVK